MGRAVTFLAEDERPWGRFVVLDPGNGSPYLVKRLEVKAGHATSLQFHYRRREVMTLVSGTLEFELNGNKWEPKIGATWVVEIQDQHRLRALGEDAVVIETQIGDCDEDDIERLDDDYGRS